MLFVLFVAFVVVVVDRVRSVVVVCCVLFAVCFSSLSVVCWCWFLFGALLLFVDCFSLLRVVCCLSLLVVCCCCRLLLFVHVGVVAV